MLPTYTEPAQAPRAASASPSHRNPRLPTDSDSAKLVEALVALHRVAERDALMAWADDQLRALIGFSQMACLLAEPHGRSFRIRDVISTHEKLHCLIPPTDDVNRDADHVLSQTGLAEASGALLDHWMRGRCAIQMGATAAPDVWSESKVIPLLDCFAVDAIAVHGVKEAFSGSSTFCFLGTAPEHALDDTGLGFLELLMPSLHIARQRIYRTERARGNHHAAVGLTPREIKILALLAEGKTDDAVARETGRSVHTIKNQVRHLVTKLGARNRTQAMLLARHHDLIGPER